MTTANTANRTATHYILIERNAQGRQNWKSTPYYSLQDTYEARDMYANSALVGTKHEVRAILADGTYIML
jgi:hypothetical protein